MLTMLHTQLEIWSEASERAFKVLMKQKHGTRRYYQARELMEHFNGKSHALCWVIENL